MGSRAHISTQWKFNIQSQFSIMQWLVPPSSARIIHASGCFSYSECFHLAALLIVIFSASGSIRLSALRKSVFWLEILPLVSQAFSVSIISQFIASCKSATCHNAKTRLLHLNSCASFRMSIVESYQLLSSRNC